MTTYYLSNSGNDSNNGLSESLPFQTIEKINSVLFLPGDSILFKRGDTWLNQGFLYPRAGNSTDRVTYGAYGSGAKPVLKSLSQLSGWQTAANWTQSGESWYIESTAQPKRMWLNGVEILRKEALPTTAVNKFYITSTRIYLYSSTNPATTFSSIEATVNSSYVVYCIGRSYITLSNLDIQGGNQALRIKGGDNWIVEDCNIGAYTGGSGISANAETGVYETCNNWVVRNCNFDTKASGVWGWESKFTSDAIFLAYGCNGWNIYNNTFSDWGHNALSIANLQSPYFCSNNKFHNNYTTSESIDYGRGFGYSSINDLESGNEIYDNVFYNHASMSEINGKALKLYRNIFNKCREVPYRPLTSRTLDIDGFSGGIAQYCEIYNNVFAFADNQALRFGISTGPDRSNNKVINNIFYECDLKGTRNALEISTSAGNLNNTFQNNLFFKTGVSKLITYFSGTYTAAEFNAINGTDGNVISNNIQGDPLFIDAPNGDFRLKANSPANNTGISVGLTTDYYGNAISGNPDIGIFESFNQTGAKRVLKTSGGKYYRNPVTGKFYVR